MAKLKGGRLCSASVGARFYGILCMSRGSILKRESCVNAVMWFSGMLRMLWNDVRLLLSLSID